MRNYSLKKTAPTYTSLPSIPHHTTDLFLSCCGRQICPADYSYGPVVRMEYLIHFIVKGSGTFCMNGISYKLTSNQFFFIPPGISVEYYADHEDPWEYIWFGFQGNKAASYLDHTGLSIDAPVGTFHMSSKLIEDIMENLFHTDTASLPDELDRIGYLHRLLALLTDSYQSSQISDENSLLLNKKHTLVAIQYLENNYGKATVSDLANHLGLNRAYLHTLFKKEFDMSPQQYLIHFRLQTAAEKLLDTTSSIQEISDQVGYQDTVSFSKAFKKHFGISPKQYRIDKEGDENE